MTRSDAPPEKLWDFSDIAAACGVTRQTLHYWEKEVAAPPPRYAKGLLRLYSSGDVITWLATIAGGKYVEQFRATGADAPQGDQQA